MEQMTLSPRTDAAVMASGFGNAGATSAIYSTVTDRIRAARDAVRSARDGVNAAERLRRARQQGGQ